MEDNSVNLIDNIECKFKDWNSYFKLALDDENISSFKCFEEALHRNKNSFVFHHPVQAKNMNFNT